jgi:mycoredoxin-dependent peroxiredoxin
MNGWSSVAECASQKITFFFSCAVDSAHELRDKAVAFGIRNIDRKFSPKEEVMKSAAKLMFSLAFAIALVAAASSAARALEVGDKAPDFELESSKGGKLKLSDLKGKNVLINFYVLDFSPTWIKDLQASGSDNYSSFQAENTEVVGISGNAPFSQKAFADFAKITYPLLSDRDGKVMQAFGVYDEPRRVAKRSYVIVDKDGVVRYLNIRPTNSEKDLLSTEELLSAVKKVSKGS